MDALGAAGPVGLDDPKGEAPDAMDVLGTAGPAGPDRLEGEAPSEAKERGRRSGLDLENLTGHVVSLFRAGHREEALQAAVAFAEEAGSELGRSHPTHINALATVAALVDQMGDVDEADALMLEAEGLQEEREFASLGLGPPEEPRPSEEQGTSSSPDQSLAKQAEREAQSQQLVAEGDAERGARDTSAASCESSKSSDSGSVSSGSSSWGGGEGDVDWDGTLEEELQEAEEEELEAETLTRLTWEVNALLRDGRPDEAAQLLSETERMLVEGSVLGGISKAAIHTLWAAVLEDVGEKEKARLLYDEALVCLQEEALPEPCSQSSSESDCASAWDGSGAESLLDALAAESAEEPCVPALPDAEPALPEPAVSEAPREVPVKVEEPAPEQPESAQRTSVFAMSEVAVAEELHGRANSNASEQTGRGAPSTPSAPSPSEGGEQVSISPTPPKTAAPLRAGGRKRPPPLAPQKPGATRADGFIAPPKPKARSSSSSKEIPVIDSSTDSRNQGAKPSEAPAAKAEPLAESPVVPPEPTLQAAALTVEAIKSSLLFADHFTGLLRFDRAADLLEEQLVALSSKDCPHRSSDLHVDVLLKYGGILWWEGDAEGAIDAFDAADEVLAGRCEESEGAQSAQGAEGAQGVDLQKRQRRAEIAMQAAQVYRGCGDLDAAHGRLSESVRFLAETQSSSKESNNTLREALAALAQVCVQRGDFDKAQELYLQAFAHGEGEAQADGEEAKADSEAPLCLQTLLADGLAA
mmetsp:Transcript_77/g.263  ORF Transcript_77/g.263 Transcript_77/m.263 type:complete len:756 (-) Transcript_77:359-2626(-)